MLGEEWETLKRRVREAMKETKRKLSNKRERKVGRWDEECEGKKKG